MRKLLLLSVVFALLSCGSLFAQASLAEGDTVDFTVTIGNEEENITCIQDALKPHQWYYIPNKPRLVVVKNKKTKEELPSFSLVKYQARDPNDPQSLLEGGVLQAAINLALPPTALDQLKTHLAKKTGIEEAKITVAPLSMSDSQMTVYSPGGEKMGDAPMAPDVGPAFANQAIPIQINLNRLGADFTDALCKSGGGIPVFFVFNFNGLTPKCGFKVTVDWDQSFKHFSTQTKAKASGGWGWFSGSAQTDISTVRESLVTNKCIKVESIAGDAFKAEDIDKYLEPILDKINKELFEMEAPEKVEPAKASEPNVPSRRWGFSAGVSFSLKSVEKVKKGSTVYQMDRQQLLTRSTVVGGLIGIGNYPKEVQDKLIVTMPHGNWESAWYSIPDAGSADSIGVTEIAITVKVVDDKKKAVAKCPQQTVKWTANSGVWMDPKGNERTTLLFPLADVYQQFKGKEDKLFYSQKIDVTQKVGNKTTKLTFNTTAPMFDGEAAISTPMSGIECVEVNGSLLTWFGESYPDYSFIPESFRGEASDLTNVTVTLKTKSPNKTYTGTLTNKTTEFYFLLDKGGNENPPVTEATLLFNSKKNKQTVSSKDALSELGGEIFLTDIDYLPAS